MQDKVKKILAEFDFGRVWTTMKALKWTYGEKETPSIGKLYQVAQELFENLERNPDATSVGTGGFYVYRCGDDIGLKFVVEDVSSDWFE